MVEKSKYDNIEIPDELDSIINNALKEGKTLRRKTITKKIMKKTSIVLVILIFSMISLVNVSPVFAKAIYEIPLIGDLCQVLTFRSYHFEDEIKYVDVKIPNIVNTGKTDLERRVNTEIQNVINQCVKESEDIAKDYYEAFIETGGKAEEFIPVGITVDYDVKYINKSIVSFVVTQQQTAFSAYNHTLYYNIDLETNRYLTLKDLFGSDFVKIISTEIENTINGWNDEKRNLLWSDLNISDLISENTNFYINQDNQVVIVFEKYEAAAGSAGNLEFLITTTLK
ncbi:DUF3298 and DUF4163 domain-containing protein [Anaerorhabdus sp.]|uniref:DUF3298 and DUF4163 domain-containing protein n=1 Tax=Anaerorhabdus sp. TaxID=1872524 RepID=UPI002FCA53CD